MRLPPGFAMRAPCSSVRGPPIAAGDYATGTNHILPTGARGASVERGRRRVVRALDRGAAPDAGRRAARIAPTVEAIAAAEGLPAHAASVRARAERAARASDAPDDPIELLRRPGPVTAYPAEPSDEELAARGGRPGRIGRARRHEHPGRRPARRAVRGALERLRRARSRSTATSPTRGCAPRSRTRLGVDPRRIVPGAGADELIRLVTTLARRRRRCRRHPDADVRDVRGRGAPGRRTRRRPAAQRARPAASRWTRSGPLAEREAARLVWLCTPNNPTGDAYPLDEVRALADGLPALVCVDEVYLEFGEDSTGARTGVDLGHSAPGRAAERARPALAGQVPWPGRRARRLPGRARPSSPSGSTRSGCRSRSASPSEALALAALAPTRTARATGAGRSSRHATASTPRCGALGCEALPSVTNFVAFRPPIDAADGRRGAARARRRRAPLRGRADGRLAARHRPPRTPRRTGCVGHCRRSWHDPHRHRGADHRRDEHPGAHRPRRQRAGRPSRRRSASSTTC